MKHSELKAAALNKAKVRKEYESLTPEYQLLRRLLNARKKAGLTQEDIAKRMGTKAPAVTRLESSLLRGRHSPSIATLKKYARVLGCRLDIRLVHEQF